MLSRVILADDHYIVIEGLTHVLSSDPDVEIVGQATNGNEAVELTRQIHPDIVIMDISMPELNGVDATRQIKKMLPEVNVIILSMHNKRQFVMDTLKAGATGYVLKVEVSTEVLKAIRTVVEGKVYLSPQVSDHVVRGYLHQQTREDEINSRGLTSREREILQLVSEGLNSKEIAHKLTNSPKTIDSTRRRIMEKLDIHDVPNLTKYAIREGLTTLD